ncbi:MAG: polysaccharide biosynthesis C-terminal domain-containing protein [Flavobacteriales bacterium]|nr:polysaccharide biosynthesis C-terminal domain-containing protein [Flavobacteriales bacterium]
MGIVIKQAFKTTVYSYVGAGLGFLTVWFVYRKWLTPEQNGLINLLISISAITGSLSNLGMTGVTLRFFPYFRDEEKKHHGFLFYPLIITLVGYLIFTVIFFLLKDEVIARNAEKSSLFGIHIGYLLPLTFFTAMYYIFDTYSRSIYLPTAGIVIKEVLLRIGILIAAFLYHLDWYNFESFLFIYCTLTCSIGVALGIYLTWKKEVHLVPVKNFVTPKLSGEMRSVAIFSIITGLSSLLITSLDKIIVNDQIGLQAAGVFSLAAYFGTIIQIPGRSLVRISAAVISDSWKSGHHENIRSVYHKTCLNQMILGLIIFLGIATNMDNIMLLLPPEYAEGRWVIILMSIAYLIDLATGVNGVIISTSAYYRYDTFFMLLLMIVTAVTNMMLIPVMGLTGAAWAAVITYASYNFLRYVFIWKKFNMQPYDISFLKILFFATIAYFSAVIIPATDWAYLNIFLRGTIACGLFVLLVFKSNLAMDFNVTLIKYSGMLLGKKDHPQN